MFDYRRVFWSIRWGNYMVNHLIIMTTTTTKMIIGCGGGEHEFQWASHSLISEHHPYFMPLNLFFRCKPRLGRGKRTWATWVWKWWASGQVFNDHLSTDKIIWIYIRLGIWSIFFLSPLSVSTKFMSQKRRPAGNQTWHWQIQSKFGFS